MAEEENVLPKDLAEEVQKIQAMSSKEADEKLRILKAEVSSVEKEMRILDRKSGFLFHKLFTASTKIKEATVLEASELDDKQRKVVEIEKETGLRKASEAMKAMREMNKEGNLVGDKNVFDAYEDYERLSVALVRNDYLTKCVQHQQTILSEKRATKNRRILFKGALATLVASSVALGALVPSLYSSLKQSNKAAGSKMPVAVQKAVLPNVVTNKVEQSIAPAKVAPAVISTVEDEEKKAALNVTVQMPEVPVVLTEGVSIADTEQAIAAAPVVKNEPAVDQGGYMPIEKQGWYKGFAERIANQPVAARSALLMGMEYLNAYVAVIDARKKGDKSAESYAIFDMREWKYRLKSAENGDAVWDIVSNKVGPLVVQQGKDGVDIDMAKIATNVISAYESGRAQAQRESLPEQKSLTDAVREGVKQGIVDAQTVVPNATAPTETVKIALETMGVNVSVDIPKPTLDGRSTGAQVKEAEARLEQMPEAYRAQVELACEMMQLQNKKYAANSINDTSKKEKIELALKEHRDVLRTQNPLMSAYVENLLKVSEADYQLTGNYLSIDTQRVKLTDFEPYLQIGGKTASDKGETFVFGQNGKNVSVEVPADISTTVPAKSGWSVDVSKDGVSVQNNDGRGAVVDSNAARLRLNRNDGR